MSTGGTSRSQDTQHALIWVHLLPCIACMSTAHDDAHTDTNVAAAAHSIVIYVSTRDNLVRLKECFKIDTPFTVHVPQGSPDRGYIVGRTSNITDVPDLFPEEIPD